MMMEKVMEGWTGGGGVDEMDKLLCLPLTWRDRLWLDEGKCSCLALGAVPLTPSIG